MLQHSYDNGILPGPTRDDIPKLLTGGIGVELGVWKGHFSKRILEFSNLDLLISIDSWRTGLGGEKEYAEAVEALSKFNGRSTILRMDFERAVTLFADRSFDFIYIDGDHRYEPVKRDITQWWPKMKPGGIFAGHDYEPGTKDGRVKFGVIEAVNELVDEYNLELNITSLGSDFDWGYRSWYVRCP